MAISYFYQPVRVFFNDGEAENLTDIANAFNFKRGLLVAESFLLQSVAAKKLIDSGKVTAVFSDITSNPKLAEAERAAKLIRESNADFVIAMGGGSALDLAKFACSYAKAEYPINDYFYKRREFTAKGVPLIAVPTTSGTGSEVTGVAVLTDSETGIKAPIANGNFYPYAAVVDPLLTLTVPPKVTASTGLDALSHALEGFWSVNHNSVSDTFAAESTILILNSLLSAYIDGKNIDARRNMSRASLYAGFAFATPKTAGVHACSYPLSEDYGLPHGEACALTLDSFIRLNAEAENGRLNTFAIKLGFTSALTLADEVSKLKIAIGLNKKLSDYGITDIDTLAEKCAVHPLMANNPRRLSVAELGQMFAGLADG